MTGRLRALQGLVLLLLVSGALPGGSATSAAASGPDWFGPKGVDEGWHMRIDVTVTNPFKESLENAPVAAELDVAKALLDAGWPSFDAGAGPVLSGFDLDPNSVRVVQVSNHATFTGAGSADGRILGEVPAVAMRGLLGLTSPLEDLARPFDSRGNPALTVFFRVPGPLGGGKPAYFEVYFDTMLNGPKSAAPLDSVAGGAVQALHWQGTGVRLYGTVATRQGVPNTVTILAPFDGTDVQVTRLSQGGGGFVGRDVDLGGGSNQKRLAAGGIAVAQLGPQANPLFRIEANKPIVAAVEQQGFVPALDGGLVGRHFMLKTGATEDGRAVYLINPGNALAKVDVTVHDPTGDRHVAYEIPAGFYGGSNLECNAAGAWQPLPKDRVLSIDVTQGGPVLVQLQPRFQQQVPSAVGAPDGNRFLGTALWSSASQCQSGVGQRLQAAPTVPGTTLRVTGLERNAVLFPAGSASPTLGNPPALTEFALPIGDSDARDRPVLFEASAPVRLFAGGTATNGLPGAVAGPLGGSAAGREFLVPGDSIVIAPYPETHVHSESTFADGKTAQDDVLGRDGVLSLGGDPELGPLRFAVVTSDRPVLAYPRSASPGYLGGVPAFLSSTLGTVAYRGRLLDLRAASGEDPLQVSLKGGVETAIPLVVSNLGRGAIGADPPTETVRLDAGSVPDGWSVRFSRSDVPLAPGESQSVLLHVKPPAEGSQASATLSLVAKSTDRAGVQDTLTVVAFQKTTYGVGLWFLKADLGPKSMRADLAPGETESYPVVVKNLGSQVDTIRLSASGTEGARLETKDGAPQQDVQLKPGQSQGFQLVVPAGDRSEGLLVTSVLAQSNAAAAARDRVTALTRIRIPSDLKVTPLDAYRLVPDGAESVFRFRLRNLANGSADAHLTLASGAPPEWPASVLFVVDPIDHHRVPVADLSVAADSTTDLVANLTVPAGTAAGTVFSLHLAASSGSSYGEASALALVGARHALPSRTEPDVPTARSGSALQFDLVVRNLGNVNETLAILPSDLPDGWRLAASSANVTQGGSARVSLSVEIPAAAPAGRHPMGLRLVSLDGTVSEVRLNVTVDPSTAGIATGRGRVEAQPGQRLAMAVPFHNQGNQPVAPRLGAASGEAWAIEAPNATLVAPGANVTLYGVWFVPRNAPSGAFVHHAVVLLGPEAAPVALDQEVAVGRPNLRLDAAEVVSGPAGTLVRTTVSNSGERDATDVVVRVLHGEKVLVEQAVQRLPAGHQTDLLVALGSPITGDLEVVVDPLDTVVELDEGDNVGSVTAAAHAAGGAGPLVLVALLAVAVLRRRA